MLIFIQTWYRFRKRVRSRIQASADGHFAYPKRSHPAFNPVLDPNMASGADQLSPEAAAPSPEPSGPPSSELPESDTPLKGPAAILNHEPLTLYENPDVTKIEAKRGPLQCERPPDDGVRLVKKEAVKEQNDEIYLGEWYTGT
jgi:hypothetical protein